MNTEQIMALADARAQAVVEASKLYAISILSSRTQDAWDKADEARNSLQAAVEELMQERDALRLVERGMEMTINDLKESRDTYQVAADKLAMENKVLRDALEKIATCVPASGNEAYCKAAAHAALQGTNHE
jgi:hypothetical protein